MQSTDSANGLSLLSIPTRFAAAPPPVTAITIIIIHISIMSRPLCAAVCFEGGMELARTILTTLQFDQNRRQPIDSQIQFVSVSLNDMSRASISKRLNRLATAAIQFSPKTFYRSDRMCAVPYGRSQSRSGQANTCLSNRHRAKNGRIQCRSRRKTSWTHTRNKNKVNCVCGLAIGETERRRLLSRTSTNLWT